MQVWISNGRYPGAPAAVFQPFQGYGEWWPVYILRKLFGILRDGDRCSGLGAARKGYCPCLLRGVRDMSCSVPAWCSEMSDRTGYFGAGESTPRPTHPAGWGQAGNGLIEGIFDFFEVIAFILLPDFL